jgi:hypothetical protein
LLTVVSGCLGPSCLKENIAQPFVEGFYCRLLEYSDLHTGCRENLRSCFIVVAILHLVGEPEGWVLLRPEFAICLGPEFVERTCHYHSLLP